jgi:hypothetical protein
MLGLRLEWKNWSKDCELVQESDPRQQRNVKNKIK